MKIVDKIRKECFLLARKKICHFIDPRHSSLDPRHFTLDPLHSPLDSQTESYTRLFSWKRTLYHFNNVMSWDPTKYSSTSKACKFCFPNEDLWNYHDLHWGNKPDKLKGLFTWRWGTLGGWGNPPVHIMSHFLFDQVYMIGGVTRHMLHLTYLGSPTSL